MRTITLTLLTFMLSIPVFGQPWLKNLPVGKSKSELTLFDYQQAFETYWAPFNVDKGSYYVNGVKKKAAGWKQFKRWEYDMLSKVNLHTGEFPKRRALEIVQEFEKTHPSPRTVSGANWAPMGPTYSNSGYSGIGRLNCIAFHPTSPDIYWVGAAAGGLWMTYEHGHSWTCLTDQNGVLAVSDIAIPDDYDFSQTIYIATGDRDGWDNRSIGVLKSTDGGQTWLPTALSYTIQQSQMVNRLLMDPSNSNVLYAATTQGVFKTIDGGATWNTQMTDREFIDMEFKPGNPGIIYGSTKGGSIFLSNDGVSFSQEIFHSDGARRTEIAVTPAQPDFIYVLCSNDGSALHGIFKSINGGNSFDEVFSGAEKNLLTWESDGSGDGGQGWYDLTIAASPVNADVVLIGGVNSWRSIDGGYDWHIINHWWGDGVQAVHADKHMLRFRPNGDLVECNDGGIYYSTDDGSSWTDKTNGIQISQMYRLGVSQSEEGDVITGLQDNGTKSLSNNNWSDVIGGDGMECLIDYTDSDIQYGTLYFGALSRTTNHWQNSEDVTPPDEGAWVTPFVIDPHNPDILYGGYSELWKTTDKGENWVEISDINLDGRLRCVAVSAADPRTIYISNYNQIWKTTDGGDSWNQVTNNLPSNDGTIEYITIKHDDPNTLWAVLSGYSVPGVYESTNGGNTWTSISEGLPPIPVYSVVQNIQQAAEVHLYVGTELGVYFKEAGNDWVPFNTGLPNVKTGEIEIYYDGDPAESKLRVATYGRGLWETNIEFQPSPMEFISATAAHKNTSKVAPGSFRQEILKVEVLTNGNLTPLSMTSFTFNTNGSTNPSEDILNAQLFYTGASNAFSTDNLFGEIVFSPDGEFIIAGNQVLGNGKNHFWLTYDVSASASFDNVLDAQCTSVSLDQPADVLVSDPAGHRIIGFEYCEAGTVQSTYEYISEVKLGWITQSSDKGPNGYQDFTHLALDVQHGETIEVDVTNGVPYTSDQVLIWVDWNADGDFDDVNEYVYVSSLSGDDVFKTSFMVPDFVRTGITRMRIRLHDASNGPNTTACGNAEWGEVEDYSLVVHAHDLCGPMNYLSLRAENIPGTYEPLGQLGNIIPTENFDDANSAPQEIGFPFVFKCDTFEQFILNTNGIIKLGNTPPSKPDLYFNNEQYDRDGGPFNSHHPDDINLLTPFNVNLTGGSGSPEYRVHVAGDAPYRVCIVQFKDLREKGPDPIPQFDKIEFQIKLYETTNVIEFVYGDWLPSGNEDDFRLATCGIKGSSGFDQQLLLGSKGTAQEWSEIYFTNKSYYGTIPVWYRKSPESPKPDPGRTMRFSPSFYNDLAVNYVYALGDASVYFSPPLEVKANIKNVGFNPRGVTPVRLVISGMATASDTVEVGALNYTETGTIDFTDYLPEGIGNATIQILLPEDDDNSNNMLTWQQNLNEFNVNYYSPHEGISGMLFGPNHEFIHYARYYAGGWAQIKSINVFIPDSSANIGKSMYGVVRGANVILGQSELLVIAPEHLGKWHSFALNETISLHDEDFFAGVAVLMGGEISYPMGFQVENPMRPSTFYRSRLDGSNFVSTPIERRLLIGATLEASPPGLGFISGGNVFCTGEIAQLEVSFYQGSIRWQESPDGIDNWVNVTTGEGWDSPEYTTAPLTTTTYYRVEVSQPTHPSIYSNIEPVIVHNRPGDAGLITGPEVVCQGDSAVVYIVDPIPNTSLYKWDFPDGVLGMSISNTIEIKFSDDAVSGEITVEGQSGICSGASSSLFVTVLPKPGQPIISQNGHTLTSNAGTGNQWFNQNGPIAGATDPDFEVTEDGTYYVVVTENDCPSEPSNSIAVIISSVIIDGTEFQCQLFPNPVADQLILEIKGNVVHIPFEIYNALGRTVFKGIVSDRTIVNTSGFIPGLYVLRLTDDGLATTRRFIKE
jgi:photosystem II stability/assembly factor-like uncharacterized protein